MDKEYALIFLPAISWLLFSLGGKKWKFWRRFALPIVYILFALIYQIRPIQGLIMGIVAVVSFHLGYGERTPYWRKFLTGCSYGLISLPLGVSFWNFFIPPAFISLFWLSNHKPFSHIFVWKTVEGLVGLFIAISIAVQL